MSATSELSPRNRMAAIAAAEDTKSFAATGLLLAAAVTMVGVHVFQLLTYTLPAGQFRNLHLAFAIFIGFLTLIESTQKTQRLRRGLFWGMATLSVILAAYIHVEYTALTEVRSFRPDTMDIVIAALLLVTALMLSGFQWGYTIPMLAIIGLAYGYWGQLMPGDLFFHAGIKPQRLIGYTSIPYFQGLLGGLTGLSASTIFMFMMFGGALKATGAIEFIVQIGFALGRRSKAGPALVAVISSGLMGTVSGSTVANVASTGALTIPLMKRYGFKPEFAGAVEAVASTGGQLMPPVMGLAAFLIVGITGISYNSVMLAAIAPALIYYSYLMLAVQLRAANMGLDATTSPELEAALDLKTAALRQWHLVISIGVLVWLLVNGMPAGSAALIAFFMVLGLDALMTVVRGGARKAAFLKAGSRVINGMVEGARAGAIVATVIAVIGILIEVLTVTGFAQKLSFAMLDLSDGSLFTLSIVVAVSCLVFGLGLPTSAAYFIVALFGAPALVEMGVPLLGAHLFVFYFANLSAVTPPVAIAALVAANIAKASFWGTSVQALRLALPGFLLPFLFLFEPEILGLGKGFGAQLMAIAQALLATAALNFVIEGRIKIPITVVQRVLLGAAALGLLYWNPWIEFISFAVIAVIVAWNILQTRSATNKTVR